MPECFRSGAFHLRRYTNVLLPTFVVHVKSFDLPCFVPCSDAIAVKQSQVDKLYASLKDLALERRDKLGEVLKLYKLNREIEDLEQWIQERETVAGSHELGQDFDHVTVICTEIVWFLWTLLTP